MAKFCMTCVPIRFSDCEISYMEKTSHLSAVREEGNVSNADEDSISVKFLALLEIGEYVAHNDFPEWIGIFSHFLFLF